jgi:hypothetical protein
MLLIPLQLCSLQRFPITLAVQVVELQKGSWFRGENHLKHILRFLQYFLNIIQRKIHGTKKNAIKNMNESRERRKETDTKK